MSAKWVPDVSRRLLDPKNNKKAVKNVKKGQKNVINRRTTSTHLQQKKTCNKNTPDVCFATKLLRPVIQTQRHASTVHEVEQKTELETHQAKGTHLIG